MSDSIIYDFGVRETVGLTLRLRHFVPQHCFGSRRGVQMGRTLPLSRFPI
jgi:hypothetical protein